jgi:hypothetical protein
MKLEAVVVCVNYSDFLAETLPLNKHQFDRMVVVTTPEDKLTQKLLEYHHVKCVQTDVFNIEGGEFRKGAGINVGLKHLDMDHWVVHLDADIALAPQTRTLLEKTSLDTSMVYGIDRFNIVGYDQWFKHLRHPKLVNEAGVYVHPHIYPLATRFMSPDHGGYLPIGFFQMWDPIGSAVRSYPECHGNAGRTDMLFSAKWPRSKRAMLPEIIAFHLESEKAAQGINWNGRLTAPFESRHWWRRWCHRRHKRKHPLPFPHPYHHHHKEHHHHD